MLATAIMIFLGLCCAGVIACAVADCWRAYRRPTYRVEHEYLMQILRDAKEAASAWEAEQAKRKRVA